MTTTALVINIILIVFGILTCLFGIWFRKVNAAIVGLVLGLCAGLLIDGALGLSNDSVWLIIIPVALGAVLAVLSAVFDRFYIVLAGFLTGAFAAFLVLARFLPGNTPAWVGFLVAGSIGLVFAVIGFFLYGRVYALLAAIDGAFFFTSSALAIALPLIYPNVADFKSDPLPFVSPFVPGALTKANAASDNKYLWATIVLISVSAVLAIVGIICQHKKAKKVG